jgi:hypothetical protein
MVKLTCFSIILLILFAVSGYILTCPGRSSVPTQFSKSVSAVVSTTRQDTVKKCKCCTLEELRKKLRFRHKNMQTAPNSRNHSIENKSSP